MAGTPTRHVPQERLLGLHWMLQPLSQKLLLGSPVPARSRAESGEGAAAVCFSAEVLIVAIIGNESNKDSVVNLTEKLYPSGYVLYFETKLKNKAFFSLIHLLYLPGEKIQTLQALFSHFHVTCLYES